MEQEMSIEASTSKFPDGGFSVKESTPTGNIQRKDKPVNGSHGFLITD